jgi:AraC-like DNA-binding protein
MRGARELVHPPSGHSFQVLRWTRDLGEVEALSGDGQRHQLKGQGNHWHFHVELELALVLKGSGTRFVGDHIGEFEAGDLVLLGEKLPHYWHTQGGSGGLVVQWYFPPGHPFWAFPETERLAALFKRAARGLRITGETAQKVSALMQRFPLASKPERLALLLRILARIDGMPEGEGSLLSVRSFSLSAESQQQQAISRSIRHVVARFREELRMEELLAVSGMSRATFARQFKKHAGHSLIEFVNRLRLQAACRELRETKHSVVEVAARSGFTQLSFFNRLFRRVHGCSPTEYRRRKLG